MHQCTLERIFEFEADTFEVRDMAYLYLGQTAVNCWENARSIGVGKCLPIRDVNVWSSYQLQSGTKWPPFRKLRFQRLNHSICKVNKRSSTLFASAHRTRGALGLRTFHPGILPVLRTRFPGTTESPAILQSVSPRMLPPALLTPSAFFRLARLSFP